MDWREEQTSAIPVDAVELMTRLMQVNSDQNFHIVDGLMKGYRSDAHRYRITLDVIREEMTELFSRGFMPTPAAIFGILNYPNSRLIKERIAEEESREPA